MNKWLKITLIALLTLAVLSGVALAGYRLGLTQNPEVIQKLADLRAQRLEQFQKQFENGLPGKGLGRGNNPHGFAPGLTREFKRGRGGFSFFSPLWGLIKLALLGALLWFGYQYAKNSGWKLVKETPPAAPAPAQASSASQEDTE